MVVCPFSACRVDPLFRPLAYIVVRLVYLDAAVEQVDDRAACACASLVFTLPPTPIENTAEKRKENPAQQVKPFAPTSLLSAGCCNLQKKNGALVD